MRLDLLIGLALVLGLGLRLWGLRYGLPHVYNPDEVAIMSRSLSLAEHGLNPGNFLYPTFYFYLLAGCVGAVALTQMLAGVVGSLQAFESRFWTDPSLVYLAGRMLNVLLGTLTILTTAILARGVGGRRVAGVAALLMAVAYVPVREAHFIKHDVPVTLLITLTTLAALRLKAAGTIGAACLTGGLAGLSFATHYYAIFVHVLVPVALALRLADEGVDGRALLPRLAGDRRLWCAATTAVAVFACASPYILLDYATAWRDITANRRIVVDRATGHFGPFGSGIEQLRILATQGAGWVWLGAVAFGGWRLARQSSPTAVLLSAFPIVFALFISNTWPYGRTATPLYPFLAIFGAVGVVAAAERTRWPAVALGAGTLVAIGQPVWCGVLLDRLMTRVDTRTVMKQWIEEHLPDGAMVAVEPYSSPLVPSRDWLRATLVASRGSVEQAGYRFRTELARAPYPRPAFRLLYIGRGGLDEDKRYVDPDTVASPEGLERLRLEGLQYVLLKRFAAGETSAMRGALSRAGRLRFAVSPLVDDRPGTPAQIVHEDVRPSLAVGRPGPLLELWELPAREVQ